MGTATFARGDAALVVISQQVMRGATAHAQGAVEPCLLPRCPLLPPPPFAAECTLSFLLFIPSSLSTTPHPHTPLLLLLLPPPQTLGDPCVMRPAALVSSEAEACVCGWEGGGQG